MINFDEIFESYRLEDAGQGTNSLPSDDPIHARESVSGVSGSAHSSLIPQSPASDTKDTLTATKNQRKRQRATQRQVYSTEHLRLAQEHELELRRMELDARAAELKLARAHERWMKECELGLLDQTH